MLRNRKRSWTPIIFPLLFLWVGMVTFGVSSGICAPTPVLTADMYLLQIIIGDDSYLCLPTELKDASEITSTINFTDIEGHKHNFANAHFRIVQVIAKGER